MSNNIKFNETLTEIHKLQTQPTTTEQYWDCECQHNYIHPKEMKWCPFCNTFQDEQPDSITTEVQQAGLPMEDK